MNIHQIFFILSIVSGFVSQTIGIYFIFKGSFKPQRTTRFIYFILNSLFLGTLITQGSWDAFGLALAQGLGGTIIFILSFKYGMGGYERTDVLTLVGALTTIIIWKLTDNPTLALLLSIVVDIIAFYPTLIKIYKHPETEDRRFYLSDIISSLFSVLSLQRLLIGDIAYPLYILCLNLFGFIFIIIRSEQTSKVTVTKI